MALMVLLSNSTVHAEVFYLTQVKHAEWNDQELNEAIEKLKEHKPIEVAEPLKLVPFHHRTTPQAAQERDFCIGCHTSMPHTQSERLRSYLNMHVNYLACVSCHYQPQGVTLNYRWQQWVDDIASEATKKIITPFHQQGAMTLTKAHPDIARLLESWEGNDIARKAEDHLRLHTPLQPEGVDCKSCHTSKTPLLDYRQLGYEEGEIKTIVENRIVRFFSEESFKDRPIILMDLLR
jgi:nitrate/TMAO reductase-like tetraheme cytochrome c subunit